MSKQTYTFDIASETASKQTKITDLILLVKQQTQQLHF
jgi:hypothetical protein